MLIPLIRFSKFTRIDKSGGYTLANHKSAAKRARQTIKKQAVNSRRKSTVKTHEKNLVKAIASKDAKSIPELLKAFVSQISRAAGRGVLKKETASRKVARLSARAQALLK